MYLYIQVGFQRIIDVNFTNIVKNDQNTMIKSYKISLV